MVVWIVGLMGAFLFLTNKTEVQKTETITPQENQEVGSTKVMDVKKEEKVMVKEITKTITPTQIITKPTDDGKPWGVSEQIGEHTWTMKVGEDEAMATAKEIFEALNAYRKVKGSQVLTWDEKLGNYAQLRANDLYAKKGVDGHTGFNDFVKNQDGFNKLGFTALGENISYGYKLNGTHIIEWMYAGDKPHDDNQLDNRWNYVGVGVKGLATCLIFGTGKF